MLKASNVRISWQCAQMLLHDGIGTLYRFYRFAHNESAAPIHCPDCMTSSLIRICARCWRFGRTRWAGTTHLPLPVPARGYEDRGFPGHLNCSDNISNAFAPYGIQSRRAWPAINFFFNSWIDWADHNISADEAWSRAGDFVVMQALTDLVGVSTACPDDVDPINGWNPTDIHVRIYEEDSSISHSVSWRAQPEDSAQMTRHSAFHPCTSKLTKDYGVSRDLWLPHQFDATGAVEEYWACRNHATLQDMSSLLKFDIVGPDAEELLNLCLTRNVAKLSQAPGCLCADV